MSYLDGEPFDVVTLDLCNWVSIAAYTPSGDVILVRQLRHGVDAVTLETPGGIVEPGETPDGAALRELTEETGFRASHAEGLGWVHPNPAFSSNRCHLFWAKDAERVSEPLSDNQERTQVTMMSQDEILVATQDGRITHALAVITLERATRARSS